MSFNSILEAEKEADTAVTVAKEKAKQMIAEALLKQERDIEEAKTQGKNKLMLDLVDFEKKLKTTIEIDNSKKADELKTFMQESFKRKDTVVGQIVANFK
jgi:vacuolar-type H+-ATPase subunit H